MVQRLSYDEFKNIYSKVPRLCVDVVIKHQGGIVLVKRSIPPCKGMWHFAGGTVLKGERLKDAVKRVAKEESGLDVNVIGPLKPVEFYSEPLIANDVSIAFLVESVGGVLEKDENAEEIGIFKEAPIPMIKEHVDLFKEVVV